MSSQISDRRTIHTYTYSTVATTMSLETYTLALSHSRARRWQRLIDEAIWGPSEPTYLGCQSKKNTFDISKNQTCIRPCTLPTILLNLVLEELILVVRDPSTYSLYPSCPNIFSYFIILRAEYYSIVNSATSFPILLYRNSDSI